MVFSTPKAALNSTTVAEVLPSRRSLIWVPSNTTISAAIKTLHENRLTAAPVFDTQSWKFIGFADVRALCLYLTWGKLGSGSSAASLAEVSKTFGAEPVSDLLSVKWAHEESQEVKPTDTIAAVTELFGRGAHRALVRLHDHPVIGEKSLETKYAILTQTDIVRYVYHQHSAFAKTLDASLDSLGLVSNRVVTIKNDESVLEGLKIASSHVLPAVPVVTRVSNTLVGNLSASDLRTLGIENLADLQLQVNTFLDKYSPASLRPVCLHSSATAHKAVREMLRNRVHRLWIVNASNSPVGVISFTDLCAMISKQQ